MIPMSSCPRAVELVTCYILSISRLYKDVDKDIWDWDIKPSRGSEGYAFWQHMFAKHHVEIANKKGLQPAKIPKGWEDVSEKKAKANLAENMFNVDLGEMEKRDTRKGGKSKEKCVQQ